MTGADDPLQDAGGWYAVARCLPVADAPVEAVGPDGEVRLLKRAGDAWFLAAGPTPVKAPVRWRYPKSLLKEHPVDTGSRPEPLEAK